MRQCIASTAKGPVEYRLEGNGPVVMVLQGGHCSRDTRLSHERLAGQGLTVLTPSRPGYDSTPVDVGRSAEQAADALAALLDTLQIATVDAIGISAAGPSALAFALRHPLRLRKLVLESAVSLPWDAHIKKGVHLLFGRAGKATWGLTRLALRLTPMPVIRAMLQELTTLDVDTVMRRMSAEDLSFVRRILETSRSGRGFINDIEHRVGDLSAIRAPTLVMYSPYDKAVPPKHALRVAAEVASCELNAVEADTHLIWIGKAAGEVWQKRLAFLKS